ncbi:MAG: hypothetical protein ACKVPX_08150 [Myxococcaceae bacterium]
MRRCSLLAFSFLALACATSPRVGALCWSTAAPDVPDTWPALLLHGYDAKSRSVPRPVRDCTGSPLFALPVDSDACTETTTPLEALPDKPLNPDDIVVSPLDAHRRLVWVKARELPQGDAIGPVALIEHADNSWVVRHMGTLQALPVRTKLRLETIGGTQLLVAEGEKCDGTAPVLCSRDARLMQLRGNRFVMASLHHPDGACAGGAVFHLTRIATSRSGSGSVQRYELTTTLDFGAEVISAHEQLTVSEGVPQRDAPPRVIRRAESDRSVRWAEGRLTNEGDPLWSRIFPQRNAKTR